MIYYCIDSLRVTVEASVQGIHMIRMMRKQMKYMPPSMNEWTKDGKPTVSDVRRRK